MIKTACPTTLNLPYSEREIKIERFGGRPPFGGRPGALGPMPPPPLNPALLPPISACSLTTFSYHGNGILLFCNDTCLIVYKQKTLVTLTRNGR